MLFMGTVRPVEAWKKGRKYDDDDGDDDIYIFISYLLLYLFISRYIYPVFF